MYDRATVENSLIQIFIDTSHNEDVSPGWGEGGG